jgi:hypothetical protein
MSIAVLRKFLPQLAAELRDGTLKRKHRPHPHNFPGAAGGPGGAAAAAAAGGGGNGNNAAQVRLRGVWRSVVRTFLLCCCGAHCIASPSNSAPSPSAALGMCADTPPSRTTQHRG